MRPHCERGSIPLACVRRNEHHSVMSARALSLPVAWSLTFSDAAGVPDTGPPEGGDVEHVGPRGCVAYSAGSLHEAKLVLDLLEEAGIEARLFNEHLIGAMGELPFGESLPKIWLPDESDHAAARCVIDAYEARQKQTIDGTRRCHACGEDSPTNFELCWSCREPFEPE